MHELSLAHGIVDAVTEAARAAGGGRVVRVKLRIGVLSGVVGDALRFSFDIATRDTPLEGAALELETVPIAVYCPRCDEIVTLPGLQRFRCPTCDTPSGDVRRGKELEITEMELADASAGPPSEEAS